jgi:hypothetical protein
MQKSTDKQKVILFRKQSFNLLNTEISYVFTEDVVILELNTRI